MFKQYLQYLTYNPRGYWFKAKLYGWGWVPVKWQGWLVVVVAAAIAAAGYYIGETEDAPGMILIGLLFGIAFVCAFGYWKGEKPRWQWGLPARHSFGEGGRMYECPECKLHYREKIWAEKCETWCKKHRSCNIEITAHAEESKSFALSRQTHE